ncbi:MAG: MucBP domain-containing protein [Erysipelothrix sp.]
MTKIIKIIATFCIVLTCFSGTIAADEGERLNNQLEPTKPQLKSEVIVIPDNALRYSISQILSVDQEAITADDMKNLTKLDIPLTQQSLVSNLEGLEYAINLKDISLQNTKVTDLEPLKDLPITSISLMRVKIGNEAVPVLNSFTNLESVEIGNTGITDLSWVAGKNLVHFKAGNNALTDADIEPLRDITTLTNIEVFRNKITDLSVFKDYTEIKLLNIWENEIEDLSPLIEYTGVVHQISAGWNKISDLTPLAHIANENLKYISLEANQISDLTPILNSLQNPTYIDVVNQEIKLGTFYYSEGESPILQNPIRDYNSMGVVPRDGSISSGGVYDASKDVVSWSNTSNSDFTAQWSFKQNYPDTRIRGFSGTVSATMKILSEYTLTVNYVDDLGFKISDPQVLIGAVDTLYDVSTSKYKLTIPGYTLDITKIPTNTIGKFVNENINVTYTYTKDEIKNGEVIVKYVDSEGNTIAPNQTISGVVGESYDASGNQYQIAIDGYALNLEQIPTNSTGLITEETSVVIYVYNKEIPLIGDVTIKYVDSEGNTIAPNQTISGVVGESYDASGKQYQIDIDGYALNLEQIPTNSTGLITEETSVVIYVYNKEIPLIGDVTIKYVDSEGNTIAPNQTISGVVGESYDASGKQYQIDIDGYTLNLEKIPTNSTGLITEETSVVTYVYNKETPLIGDVTIKYVDSEGNTIAPNQRISGVVGESYDASGKQYQIDIDGYTLNLEKIPTNSTGLITEETSVVTYVYNKETPLIGDVTIKYVDSEGNTIAPNQRISGVVGESYDASGKQYQIDIDGYTLNINKLPGNMLGVLESNPQYIVYIYEKNGVAAEKEEKTLPATGVQSLVLVATLMLVSGSMLTIISKRKRKV